MAKKVLRIGLPRTSRLPTGEWQVTAIVGGRDVHFESNFPLLPATEALATAFLFPAMSRGMDLEVSGPVCPEWLANMELLRAIARKWWSFRGGLIHADIGSAYSPAPGRALFFGGGMDSLYTLHREMKRLSHLIYLEGFDIPLDDQVRLAKTVQINRTFASACGLELVVMRTDIRRHPDFRVLPWQNAFGGIMAGSAHLLRHLCGMFLISSDGHKTEISPWASGIHNDLALAWSSPAVCFQYYGDEILRNEKAAAIAGWLLARQHIRVCWERRSPELNCGVCEKCLRTRLDFMAAGVLCPLPAFPAEPIAANLDRIRSVAPNIFMYYQDIHDSITDPVIISSIDKLGRRSRRYRHWHAFRPKLVLYWKRLCRLLE